MSCLVLFSTLKVGRFNLFAIIFLYAIFTAEGDGIERETRPEEKDRDIACVFVGICFSHNLILYVMNENGNTTA